MKWRKISIFCAMLITIHTCALSLQGENSNGQFSMERKQIMKEYSLMRTSLVYIARSIDSFFVDNKIPSHYKKILSLIILRLSFHNNAFPANQKMTSSLLRNKDNCSIDCNEMLIFPIQMSQSNGHDYDQIEVLDSSWNKNENSQNEVLLEIKQSDDDSHSYPREYSTYMLQEIDLCAELQNIYDSFNQEFNELALLAIQEKSFDVDLAIQLSSIDEIESISTYIDWDSGLDSFMVKPDNVQCIIFF